ncbi:hypothetical protein FB45DRAFT_874590 [Roridomyces roridus]|uniref:Uncharacterized protein n=1 Tax=Roridomyces roridus TaxID=1738132 RepID=A0AAD7B7I7_9AGAR|nr:hypothetical protein FB45DRAFT_874590 [Roridomyces roridus]
MSLSPTTTTTKSRPLARLALHSTATCTSHATLYGKWILATYTDVSKDACKAEFAKFARCLREAKMVVVIWEWSDRAHAGGRAGGARDYHLKPPPRPNTQP